MGDPIIIKHNENVNVANIFNIFNRASEVCDIGTDDITNDNKRFNVKTLNLDEIEENLYCDGSFKSDKEY